MTVLPFLVPGTTGFSLASPSRAYTLDTTGSCCAVFEDELVLASGRPSTCAKNAGAMALITPAHATDWHRGRWRQLPPLSVGRVGGGALVIHGRLLVTGGCDEVKRQFDGGAEYMDATVPPLPLGVGGDSVADGDGGSRASGRRGDGVPTDTDVDYESLFPDSDSGDEDNISGGCGGGAIVFDAVGGGEYERQLKQSFDQERAEQLAHDQALRAHNGVASSSTRPAPGHAYAHGSGGSERSRTGRARRRLGGAGGFRVLDGYVMPRALHGHSMFALPRLTFAG